jgi:hypothetical protein
MNPIADIIRASLYYDHHFRIYLVECYRNVAQKHSSMLGTNSQEFHHFTISITKLVKIFKIFDPIHQPGKKINMKMQDVQDVVSVKVKVILSQRSK